MRLLRGLLLIVVLLGAGYVAYSGWYSYQRYQGSDTQQTCIDGVPVANAASIEQGETRFRWQWGPVLAYLPLGLDDLPASDIIKTRLPKSPVRNTVIIQFTDESRIADRRAYVESIGGSLGRSISRLNTYVVNFEDNLPRSFPPSSIVVNIERDNYATVTATNDEFYGQQWALPYLGVADLWRDLAENTDPVTVAVIDSGICKDHPDLGGRVGFGWDFVEADNDPQDEMGHGCGVAGVIAAIPDNRMGVAGVVPVVEFMPLRVLNKYGVGTQSDIAAAIMFAADRRVEVINLSLASPNPSVTVENAINYALAKNVIVIAAAGNNGTEGAWYPAAYPNVTSVGALDRNEERSSFSNFGANVDIYAPGRDIYTTSVGGNYRTMTGTSFAAPLVSGLTALEMTINNTRNTGDQEMITRPPVASDACP